MERIVFETLLTVAGVAVDLDAHLARLARSASRLALPDPPLDRLRTEVSGLPEGTGRLRLTWPSTRRPLVMWQPLDARNRARIVEAVVEPAHRFADVKHEDRAGWVDLVARSGADDVLLLDQAHRVREATMAAVFTVAEGRVFAAPDDGAQLASIGLARVLAHCRAQGIEVVRERPMLSPRPDGVYLVSALRGVEPVVVLDDWRLEPEPLGRKLLELERRGVGL